MKNFNIIISGTGGQGIITLTRMIAEATLIEGVDVKTSELHGLSQRGGSVETHIKIGEGIDSPLVSKGEADLIISLETFESLRSIPYANKNTLFLVNKSYLPFEGSWPSKKTESKLKEIIKDNLYLVPASDICKQELGKEVVSGVYLLAYAALKGFIPLKPGSVKRGILKIIPSKHSEINKKAIELASR